MQTSVKGIFAAGDVREKTCVRLSRRRRTARSRGSLLRSMRWKILTIVKICKIYIDIYQYLYNKLIKIAKTYQFRSFNRQKKKIKNFVKSCIKPLDKSKISLYYDAINQVKLHLILIAHNFPPYHIISEVARILPSHLAFTAIFYPFKPKINIASIRIIGV